MATDLIDWGPEVNPSVPGLPQPGLKLGVRNAAIEFCQETLLWAYTLTAMDVEATVQAYTLTIPDALHAEVVGIDTVKYKQNGEDDTTYITLPPLSENEYDLIKTGAWKYQTSPTPSKYWSDVPEKQVHLWPIPSAASTGGLLVTPNLRPTKTTDDLPDFLWEDYRKAIAKGAIADLLNRPALTFFNPELAATHRLIFENKMNDAKVKKITGATKRGLRVRMRNWL